VESHQHGPDFARWLRLSGIVAIDRGLNHRLGMGPGPVRSCTLDPGPQPSLPSLPSPTPKSRSGRGEHVTTSGCRQCDKSLFCVTRAWCGMVSGGFNTSSANWNWIHMQSALPPASRYRTTSTSGGLLPCPSHLGVCSVHVAWQQPKQRKMGNPSSPLLPTHHHGEGRCFSPVVPAKLGSSRAITEASSHTAREKKTLRHWAPTGANPMSPLLVPDPRAPSGVVWRHVRHTSTDDSPALAPARYLPSSLSC
jgi:hypothetical protein